MPTSTSSEGDPAPLLRAPLWGPVLDDAVGLISDAPTSGLPRTQSVKRATEAVDQAESRILSAKTARSDTGLASGCIGAAVAVMLAVEPLSQRHMEHDESQHAGLVRGLRRRLSGHEEAVLAGEVTYAVPPEAGHEPAMRLRLAFGRLGDGTSQLESLSIRKDALDLAAMLILAAANVKATGSAREAPQARTSELDHTLKSITRILAVNAEAVDRPVHPRGDLVAHHLAAGLRVRVASETLARLEASLGGDDVDGRCLDEATDAWFRLATHEYVAVHELDHQLERSAHADTFSSLGDAMLEGAAHVICGARLLDRPSWFLHRRAWNHHTVALTYASEAYVAGIRGDPASMAQAQLIALTRLTRAITALVMLELRRDAAPRVAARPER